MDTLTHIVVGACIGEIIAGKQLGKKALVLGALANSIPDVDFIAAFWMPVTKDLLAHRGFTHSLLFAILFTPLLAFLSEKLFRRQGIATKTWLLFWGIQLFAHLFIDLFNAYGTGLFEPFSHFRVSFNTMFVADPMFSIWPGIAVIILLILKVSNNKRMVLAWSALALCSIYLLSGIGFKFLIDNAVTKDFNNRKMVINRYFTTPTPLNNLLWYIVAQNDSGYYIGYRSVFDRQDTIDYHYARRNESLLALTDKQEDINRLLRFSQGYYTVENWHDTLTFNDLRFGEIIGWAEPHPKVAFHYFLQYPEGNKMVVQRGRFAKWDKKILQSFINRIKGI